MRLKPKPVWVESQFLSVELRKATGICRKQKPLLERCKVALTFGKSFERLHNLSLPDHLPPRTEKGSWPLPNLSEGLFGGLFWRVYGCLKGRYRKKQKKEISGGKLS